MAQAKTNVSKSGEFKLSYRLTLYFFFLAVVVSAMTTYALYRTADEQMMLDIRQRLNDIVSIAAASLDGDAHAKLTDPSQEGGPAYLAFRKDLQKIKNASSDVYFTYTMRKGPKGTITFVVDAETNTENIAHLGEVYDDASQLLRTHFAALSGPVSEQNVYTDEWGTWLSGYAPFYTSDGSRAGVLGIDISAATVTAYKEKLLLHALVIFGITLPLILGVGYLVGRAIAKPIVAMKEGAEQIGQGNLNTRVDITRHDEIGFLAESLNDMAAKLKQSRARLAEMAEKFRNIFENAGEGIFQTSSQGRFLTANKSMARMLGYDSPEELMEAISDVKSQVYARHEDRDKLIDGLRESESVKALRVLFKRKDESSFWVEVNAHISQDKNGETIIEGMVQDITQRIEKEKADEKRHAAEAASQAKSEFLANMSHEIRTPLNAIMGLTDLVMRTELTSKQRGYLSKVTISSKSLLAVINDILDFSKIEAGRLELDNSDFSLYDVMANLSEMFSHKAHEKQLELIVSIGKDTPCFLHGDEIRLSQILINLTGNALKFTDQGEVVIEVKPAEHNDSDALAHPGKTRLEFSVTDTGVGIPPDRQKKIFESFSQADASTTRKFGGTGLGLTISTRLSKLMGGELNVYSEPGKGTRFFFTALFSPSKKGQDVSLVPPEDLRGLKVLVVDDNKTARDILAEMINSFKMRAYVAASGEEALEAIEQAKDEPYDLVLMDWNMPGLNGMETSRRIKRDFDQDKIPIICMISAYAREDLIQQSDKNNLDAFLHKPVNQSFLFDSIMNLFGRQGIPTSTRPATTGHADSADATPGHLAGARVLLVEDNGINMEIAREWLESADLYVTPASNGRLALEALEKDSFDVVLMDIQMPEMDGLDATKHIRRQPRFDALPIIAMTAHALKGDKERCLKAGMNEYVTKPIDPREMFRVLGECVAPDKTRSQQAKTALENVSQQKDASELPFDQDPPGISLENGLYRANNKPALYLRLLGSFLEDFGEHDVLLKQSIQDNDLELARKQAHSIKGVSGNLGAQRLHLAATELEKAGAEKVISLESPVWLEFERALQEVMQGLKPVLFRQQDDSINDAPSAIASAAPGALNTKEIAQKLETLAGTLDDDLNLARGMAEDIQNTLAGTHLFPLAKRILDSINDFDLDAAEEAMEEIVAALSAC